MVFNDTVTKLGLIQDCEIRIFGDNGYGRITGDSDLLYQFTARINRAQERFTFLAMNADGRWQYDDTNNTDYPIATTDIVSGQRDYTFALEHLELDKILIKDSGGTWKLLTNSIDTSDTFGADTTAKTYLENNTGNTGTPTSYDKIANSVFLQPTPNYNSIGGLKVYFKRGPNYFVYTDTTKVPGFASILHGYLSLHASYRYAADHSMSVAGGRLRNGAFTGMALEVNDMEMDIGKFYGLRNKDEKPRMIPLRQNNK